MPAIVWIAISIAIVMLGIGGSASFPAMPEHVFRPVVEKSFELFKPIAWALALAFGVVAAIFGYRKFFRKEEK